MMTTTPTPPLVSSSYNTIELEVGSKIARLTLSRPDSLNAAVESFVVAASMSRSSQCAASSPPAVATARNTRNTEPLSGGSSRFSTCSSPIL